MNREADITINVWRPMHRNTLRGFLTCTLPDGKILHDVAVHISNGKAWAAPPAKPRLDRDKRQVTLDGKLQWDPVISFRTRALRDDWSRQIIAALLRAYPDALDDDGIGP